MENELVQLILVALIALGASYIQSVTGFGFGIFAMIFLPSILLYNGANLLSTMLSTVTSVIVVLLTFRNVSWKNMIFPLIGSTVSTLGAVAFMKTQDDTTLILLLGIALVALSIYFFFFSDKIKIKPTWYAGLIAGLLSGVMGGMFSMSGPPVVVYYMQSEKNSDNYLATISAYFVLSNVVSIGAKIGAGFASSLVWVAFAVGILGLAAGSFAGKLTRDRIKPSAIKRCVYGVMAVSGVVNIVTAIV